MTTMVRVRDNKVKCPFCNKVFEVEVVEDRDLARIIVVDKCMHLRNWYRKVEKSQNYWVAFDNWA